MKSKNLIKRLLKCSANREAKRQKALNFIAGAIVYLFPPSSWDFEIPMGSSISKGVILSDLTTL
jgi:hypothetical protein